MAARRKLRRVSQHHRQAIDRIHERLAQDLPRGSITAPIVVDDPHGIETGEKIVVLRSLRNDPIAAMHARGQVDQAQFAAARHWQRCHERVEVGGASAIDPAKEAVDGGPGYPEPLTDAMRRAAHDLARAGRALGQEGEAIVRDVLGAGMTLLLAAAARGLTTERELIYFGGRFREALETLAKVFGYTNAR